MSNLLSIGGAGNPAGTGFYKHLLDQSIQLNDDDSSHLKRTPASAGNRRTWTWSAWVKFGAMSHGTGQITLFDASSSSSEQHGIVFSGQQFYVFGYTSGFTYRKMLTALHRDPSAWYHYVVAFDTTDSTAADRIKIYVNGTIQTSFDGTNTNPDENYDTGFNNTVAHGLGARLYDGANYFDGYIAEVNMIDGTALTAASFGETKDGIWTPKDTSGLTFGTNGFHLTFKDDVVSEGFNTVTYTGTGASNSISGVGFSPAFVWLKDRTDTTYNYLSDVCRGATNEIYSNATDGQYTGQTQTFKSFDGDGFTVGTNTGVNGSGDNMVGWCWEAGGTPTADNSAGVGATPTAGSVKIDGSNLGSALGGSIAATRISANTAKGFSITTYTGTGGTKTVAHGLGATPAWVMVKVLDTQPTYWRVWHTGVTSGQNLLLNDAAADSAYANRIGTNHTSSVVELIDGTSSDDNVNDSGGSYVMYSWTDISGYSKFGSYSGNGSTTGPTVTTGFAPAWVMIKGISGASHWQIWDTTRSPSNPNDKRLFPNLADVEDVSSYAIEVTATGFQIKHNGSDINTNGHTYIYMAFADTREAAFFKDVTTNGNHFTPVNLDYRDSVPDTPTNNFATLNPLDAYNTGATLSEGNLKWTIGAADGASRSTYVMTAGKWYVEFLSNNDYIGVVSGNADITVVSGTQTVFYVSNGNKRINSTVTSYGASYSNGDIIGIALDLDASPQTVTFYKNNASQGALNLTDVGNEGYSVSCGSGSGSTNATANFGQDSSFAGLHATANSNADGNGHGSFAYAPPSGFLALCSQNLPDVEIIDGTEYFNTVLYTGNGSTQSITGVGFSPDWLWIKNRQTTYNHALVDSVRGATLSLASSSTAAERTSDITSLDSDGFSLQFVTATGSFSENQGSQSYVAWNWLAGTAFSNDASATSVGTIDSEGQVNTKAGFSIVKYVGNNATGATVAHGLSSAPEMIIIKDRDTAGYNWHVYHAALGATNEIKLNLTNAAAAAAFWNNTAPTSSVFTVNGGGWEVNTNTKNHIAYCFHSVEGYSKVGSYTGNGSTDGPFIYTGFRPAWIMVKNANRAESWVIRDSKRDTYNTTVATLLADSSGAEFTWNQLDILSNGFKLRAGASEFNFNGETMIYLAFAETPFKYANAR